MQDSQFLISIRMFMFTRITFEKWDNKFEVKFVEFYRLPINILFYTYIK